MKSPEEIKKGLYTHTTSTKCTPECPYDECAPLPHDCIHNICKDALALIEQLECKAKPITCGECEYYGKSPMGSTQQGWCRLDCKHRSPGFWCANADRRANK